MQSNNAMLFVFTFIFIALAFCIPLIQSEFDVAQTSFSTDSIESELTNGDITQTNIITTLISIFFWVIGAPAWLNIIILVMRIIFYVIIYDKIRGI